MGTACIVMTDVNDTENAMNIVFDGGFDPTSPAHCAMRRVLEMIDGLGIEVREPIAHVPEPMLVDSQCATIIQSVDG